MEKVFVGMPVFNGDKTIESAIISLINQDYENIEILISDNNSTDKTQEICMNYQAKDNRIKYIRQSKKIEIGKNFEYVLKKSIGKYFMWAAADDLWGKSFIKNNVASLINNRNAIASISKSIYGDRLNCGDYPIVGNSVELNRYRYLLKPGANTRHYSLYRREILMMVDFDKYSFIGADWALVFDLLEHGHYVRSTENIEFFKRRNGNGEDIKKIVQEARTKKIGYLIPLHKLSSHILQRSSGWKFIPAIIYINAWALVNWSWTFRVFKAQYLKMNKKWKKLQ